MIRTSLVQNPGTPSVAAVAAASPSPKSCIPFSRNNLGVWGRAGKNTGGLSTARGAGIKRRGVVSAGRVLSSMAQGQQVAGTADDRVSLDGRDGDGDASSRIQLYSFATPNGMKVSIALEEMEIPYDAHTVNIMTGEQFKPEFIAISPTTRSPPSWIPREGQTAPL
ncbi:hypothetical protein CLOM_g10034 [Closterium sp. NIES-68]|nr:hypothetical protein CLOM_g10034 [Closterium sp. NIES-68]